MPRMAIARARPGVALPPPWSTLRTQIVLWRGSIRTSAEDIENNGIDLAKSRNDLDFGRGFYTTTNKRQALEFCRIKYRNLRPVDRAANRPALLQFRIRLDDLARLEALMFVRGGR